MALPSARAFQGCAALRPFAPPLPAAQWLPLTTPNAFCLNSNFKELLEFFELAATRSPNSVNSSIP
jgi:hypothetical protein